MIAFLGGAAAFLAIFGVVLLGVTGHLIALGFFGAICFGGFAVFMDRTIWNPRPKPAPPPPPPLPPSRKPPRLS